MTVRAVIPLRLKVDARAVTGDRDRFEDAVGRSIDRALATMIKELADRGDGLTYDLAQPAFRWSGSGLKGLDPDDQRACEAMLAKLVSRRSKEGLAGRAGNTGAPEVLPADARVPFDEDRAFLGSYVFDSYETNGDSPSTPSDRAPQRAAVIFLRGADTFASQYDPSRWDYDLYQYTGRAELMTAVRAVISSAAAQGSPVPSGRVAFFYRGQGVDGQAARRAVLVDHTTNSASVEAAGFFTLGGGSNVVPSANAEGELGIRGQGSTPINWTGVHRLVRLPPDGDLETTLVNRVYAGISSGVETYIQRELGPSASATEANNVRVRARAEILELVRERTEVSQRENAEWTLVYAEYRDTASAIVPGPYPDVFGADGVLPLYPILHAFQRPQGNEGEVNSGTGGLGSDAGDEGALNHQDDGGTGDETGGGDGTSSRGEGDSGDAGADGHGAGGAGGEDDEAAGHVLPVRFPFPAPTLGNPGDTLYCEPFNNEPTLEELGDAGNRIGALMRRIAWRLSMPDCKYPGQFMINAAKVWGGRASAVSGFAGERSAVMRRTEGKDGNLGDFDFEPQPSPVLETIRHLGRTTPLMTAMLQELYDVYSDPAQAAKLGGYFQGKGVSWVLHLRETFVPEFKESVGYGFKVACKSCLLQACLASRQQILERLNNFGNYWPLFDSLLRTLLAKQGQLELLREKLNAFYAILAPDMESTVATVAANWRDARQALVASLGVSETAEILEDSEGSIGVATYDGTVVGLDGGDYGIRDENGKVWTREELGSAIAMRSGIAQSIDPLVGKVVDLPQAIVIAQNDPATAKQYIRALLTEMLEKNTDVIRQAENSANYAFRASQISESYAQATVPGTSIQMGGIHLVAHQAVGDAFLGDPFYGMGINSAFGAELGRQSFIQFVEITGTILVSIMCPPLGIAVGIGVSGAHIYVAYEQGNIAGGLFDNDQVLTNAEAELNLFLTELEAVFSLIPLAGKALSLGGRGAIGAFRSGFRNAGRRALRGITRDVAKEMAAALKYGLPTAFMKELAQDQIVGKIIETGMLPIIRQLNAELSLTDLALPEPDAVATDPNLASEGERARDTHRIVQRLREGDDERARRSEGAEVARRGDP